MNFLEQFAAEWYEYSGYFVRTNIHTRKGKKGGWKVEIDVLAYKPSINELLHIETSGDSDSWVERKEKFFSKKFILENDEYEAIIESKLSRIRKIAIVGWAKTTKADLNWGNNIEVMLIPDFISIVIAGIHEHKFMSEAVPEGFPILRTIQMVHEYQELITQLKS